MKKKKWNWHVAFLYGHLSFGSMNITTKYRVIAGKKLQKINKFIADDVGADQVIILNILPLPIINPHEGKAQ